MIAEPEGAPAKSLKNMVVPEKLDITPLILAVQPMTQNVGPTPADCTHTSLATLLRLELALVFPEEEGMMQQSSVSISLSF